MEKGITFKNLILDIWLLDKLQKAPSPGISLEELQEQWSKHPTGTGMLSRTTFNRHRGYLSQMFGLNIECKDNKHYFISNPEVLKLRTLANDLLASMYEFLFLDEYRDLGNAIQPAQILSGIEYLHPIGDAIRNHKKLSVRYQKFTDDQPYDAILHPYCLKADKGRWYILAFKEESSHPVQTFALDRTLSLDVMDEEFVVDESIDVDNYFRDTIGIWVDPQNYPVQDIEIRCSKKVAKYLRTLPLHHSQREIECHDEGWYHFLFHLSPTPDFHGELKRWGEDIEIITQQD